MVESKFRNYIDLNNSKAYEYLTSQGFVLEMSDYYHEDTDPCDDKFMVSDWYDQHSSHKTVWGVVSPDMTSRKFHKLLRDNNLLMAQQIKE
jgi:hypothetical protein